MATMIRINDVFFNLDTITSIEVTFEPFNNKLLERLTWQTLNDKRYEEERTYDLAPTPDNQHEYNDAAVFLLNSFLTYLDNERYKSRMYNQDLWNTWLAEHRVTYQVKGRIDVEKEDDDEI